MLNDSFDPIANLASITAIFLTGLVVKTMDDFLDEENPLESGVFAYLGRSSYVYGLFTLLIASALDFSVTFSLFSACYILGMFTSSTMKLPSGLTGWVESLIVLFTCIYITGFLVTLWSLLIIISIQLLDDWMDYHTDLLHHATNYVRLLGREPAILLFFLTLYSSVLLQPFLSVTVFCAALIISEGVFTCISYPSR